MWGEKKKIKKEEEMSFYFAFLCSLPVFTEPRRSLLEYANIKEQSAGRKLLTCRVSVSLIWVFYFISSATRDPYTSSVIGRLSAILDIALIANSF